MVALSSADLRALFSPHDLKRLSSYGNNMLDYHVILDLLPSLATLYFSGRFSPSELKLSGVQASILLSLGLQRKTIEDVEAELRLPVSQALALFVKVVRKFTNVIEGVEKAEIEKSLPDQPQPEQQEKKASAGQREMMEDLEEGASEATRLLREQQRNVIDSLDLDAYAIPGNENAGWEKVKDLSKVVSIKNPEKRKEREADRPKTNGDGKKEKNNKKLKRK